MLKMPKQTSKNIYEKLDTAINSRKWDEWKKNFDRIYWIINACCKFHDKPTEHALDTIHNTACLVVNIACLKKRLK